MPGNKYNDRNPTRVEWLLRDQELRKFNRAFHQNDAGSGDGDDETGDAEEEGGAVLFLLSSGCPTTVRLTSHSPMKGQEGAGDPGDAGGLVAGAAGMGFILEFLFVWEERRKERESEGEADLEANGPPTVATPTSARGSRIGDLLRHLDCILSSPSRSLSRSRRYTENGDRL